MKRLSRAAFLLAAGVTIAGAAVLSFGARGGPRPAAELPDLLAQAPTDAPMILYLDLAALRRLPLFAHLPSAWTAPDPAGNFGRVAQTTGFDFAHDLDRVVLAVWQQTNPQKAVVLAEGRFDVERIRGLLVQYAEQEGQDGREVFHSPSDAPGEPTSLAFLDNRRVAIVRGADFSLALAPRSGDADDLAMRERMMGLSDSVFFAIGNVKKFPSNLARMGVRGGQSSQTVQSFDWVTITARADSEGLRVSVDGECKTDDDARTILNAMRMGQIFLEGLVADSSERQKLKPEQLAAIENLKKTVAINQSGQHVTLTFELTPELVSLLSPPKQ